MACNQLICSKLDIIELDAIWLMIFQPDVIITVVTQTAVDKADLKNVPHVENVELTITAD